MSYQDHYPRSASLPDVGLLLYSKGEQEAELIASLPEPPEPPSRTMTTKKPQPRMSSTAFRFDDVTHNQIEWLTRFCKEMSVPNASQRMIVARAIEFYTEYADELLITFQCQQRHPDVIAEQRALIDASKARVSIFNSADLPEDDRKEGELLPSYSSMLRIARNGKPNHKLPGIRVPKHMVAITNQHLREKGLSTKY